MNYEPICCCNQGRVHRVAKEEAFPLTVRVCAKFLKAGNHATLSVVKKFANKQSLLCAFKFVQMRVKPKFHLPCSRKQRALNNRETPLTQTFVPFESVESF